MKIMISKEVIKNMTRLQIRELQRDVGMAQVEPANAIGVKQYTVAEWERGISSPRASMLPALADLLHCTID